ncbi:MAG: baseplate J/gp47 family protein [Peptoniphilus sp. oral taxon 375]|nr:baseplate J/gp47 family protein [Peptoniphilus sp. oral taxon 375]
MADVQAFKQDADNYFREIYTDRNFDYIMGDLLSRVPDTMDKREGSIIWDALAPVALELVVLYYEIYNTLKNSFGITADRNSLILRALDRDVHLREASPAIIKGEFSKEIPLGHRFNFDKFNYRVIEQIEKTEESPNFYYKLECEEAGKRGNIESGNLTPIDEIGGLSLARIVGVLIPGQDEEDTEAFRQRYFDSIRRNDYGGNIDDYKRKVLDIPGVGAVKVYPIWAGGGTVKLVIQDSDYKTPSQEMIQDVQEKIDPVKNHGQGIGIAPIGHTVTVVGAKEEKINIKLKVDSKATIAKAVIQEKIRKKLDGYLKSLAKDWWRDKATVVRVSQIEARVLEIDGVIDVQDTLINGQEANLTLGDEAYPSLGEIAYV